MKSIFYSLVVASIIGCGGSDSSSSGDSNDERIVGTWFSNCADFPAGGIVLTYMFFENGDYVLDQQLYEDESCEVSSDMDDQNNGEFSIGDVVMTSDGAMARRITLVISMSEFSEDFTAEGVYRLSDDTLNFGVYEEGIVPEINYSIAYVREVD